MSHERGAGLMSHERGAGLMEDWIVYMARVSCGLDIIRKVRVCEYCCSNHGAHSYIRTPCPHITTCVLHWYHHIIHELCFHGLNLICSTVPKYKLFVASFSGHTHHVDDGSLIIMYSSSWRQNSPSGVHMYVFDSAIHRILYANRREYVSCESVQRATSHPVW